MASTIAQSSIDWFTGAMATTEEVWCALGCQPFLLLRGCRDGVGRRVSGELSRAFPDGVWLVQLDALADAVLVPHAVADALGVQDETDRDLLAALVEYLRERRLLLVLDNCEHLLDAGAQLIDEILHNSACVRVLATSQHRLGLSAEQLLHIAPLRVPDAAELTGGAVDTSRFPAMELFADRARSVNPQFRITADNQHSALAGKDQAAPADTPKPRCPHR